MFQVLCVWVSAAEFIAASLQQEHSEKGAEGGRFPGRNKGLLRMTVSPARPRRAGSNKADHFRPAFCGNLSHTEREEETNGCHSGNGLIVSGLP